MHHPGLINERVLKIADKNGRANGNPNQDDVNRADFEVATKMKSCYTLSGPNNTCYGKLKDHLENRYIGAQADYYPR